MHKNCFFFFFFFLVFLNLVVTISNYHVCYGAKVKMSITKNAFSLCGAIRNTPRLCLGILRSVMAPGKVVQRVSQALLK